MKWIIVGFGLGNTLPKGAIGSEPRATVFGFVSQKLFYSITHCSINTCTLR
jgi:hypothetical protein